MPIKILIMKKINLLIISIGLILGACTNNTYTTPETEMEKVSYSLGVNVATGVKAQGLDTIDANAVAKAFNDVFEGNDLDISEEESMKVLQDYFGKIQAKKSEQANKAGEAYLAENADLLKLLSGTMTDCPVQSPNLILNPYKIFYSKTQKNVLSHLQKHRALLLSTLQLVFL